MSNPAALLHQPGRVYWGVSDLTAAAPYGGTELGFTEDGLRLRVNTARHIGRADHTGPQTLGVWYLGVECMAFVTLKQWDDNTLARAFPGMLATGTSSGDKLIEIPGDLTPGTRMGASNSGVLAFVPLDTTNCYCFLARKAVTLQDEQAELQMKLSDPTRLQLVIYCEEDTSIASDDADRYPTRIAAIGKLEDISVS